MGQGRERRQRVPAELLDEVVREVEPLEAGGQGEVRGRDLEEGVAVEDEAAYPVEVAQEARGQAREGVAAEVEPLELGGVAEGLLVHVGDVVGGEVEALEAGEPVEGRLGEGAQGVAAEVEGEQPLLEPEVVGAEGVDEVGGEVEGLEAGVEVEGHVEPANPVAGEVELADLRVQLDGDDVEAAVGAAAAQRLVVAAAPGRAEAGRGRLGGEQQRPQGQRYRERPGCSRCCLAGGCWRAWWSPGCCGWPRGATCHSI